MRQIVMITAFLALSAVPTPAQVAGEWRVVGVATNDTLNVRRWPGSAGADVVHRLPWDATGIRVSSCIFDGVPDAVWRELDDFTKGRTSTRTWCFILKLDGNRRVFGWVNARYLARSDQQPAGFHGTPPRP